MLEIISFAWFVTQDVICPGECSMCTYGESEIYCFWMKCPVDMEKAMATHSSTLAWKIPWMEEPGRLQSMGLWRVGHNWANSLSLFTFMHWRRKWQPLQRSCLENPRDGGAWWAAIFGVAQSQTWLKWLSSSACLDLSLRRSGRLSGSPHADKGTWREYSCFASLVKGTF